MVLEEFESPPEAYPDGYAYEPTDEDDGLEE
jgi:hypothetical protein